MDEEPKKWVDRITGKVYTIATNYYPKPIPMRNYDWIAWFDELGEEHKLSGNGKTEAEAVLHLIAEARDHFD